MDSDTLLYTVQLTCAGLTMFCFVVQFLMDEYSTVDRLWGILPMVYTLLIGWHCSFTDPRLNWMLLLTVLYCVKLTYFFYRKGGYAKGGEDYRWKWVRSWNIFSSPIVWQFFNFSLICLYQNIGLMLMASPAIYAYIYQGTPMHLGDYFLICLYISLLSFQTIADQQQWNFQTEKYRRIAKKEKLTGEYAKGFLTTGLWRFSRHPNFFAEMSMWLTFYFFSVSVSGEWINWTMGGFLYELSIFLGSTPLTEYISSSKYPEYKNFQKTTSVIIPWFYKKP